MKIFTKEVSSSAEEATKVKIILLHNLEPIIELAQVQSETKILIRL